jgi:hypothetical protein
MSGRVEKARWDYCSACGEQFFEDARFCRSCGSARGDVPEAATTAQSPVVTRAGGSAATGQDGVEGGNEVTASVPAQREPGFDPGARSSHAPLLSNDEPLPSGGYPAAPGEHPPPPSTGYPGGPVGYPEEEVPGALVRQSPSPNSRRLIGGSVAVALAIIGAGVGIVIATSGGSGIRTRLVAPPVVTGAVTSSTVSASPSRRPSSTSHGSPSSAASGPKPSAVVGPRATISSSLGQQQEVSATITRHFALISEHKFTAAYALLAPDLKTGEAAWVDSHRKNGIYRLQLA